MKHIDLLGQKFGRLTVIGNGDRSSIKYGRGFAWLCRCECGNTTTIPSNSLRTGNTKSCGCLGSESRKTSRKKHGHASQKRSKVYIAWQNMVGRCHRPTYRNFYLWGGRGISVCPKWRHSFESFLDDVGQPPTKLHQIDRIDNGGNYEPSNVKWSTRAEQNRNKRSNRLVSFNGRTMVFSDWVKETGIPHATLYARMFQLGWSTERALTTTTR